MPKGDEQTAAAVLLVKFSFTNSALIPSGLRMTDPDGTRSTTLRLGRDRVHALKARKKGLAELAAVGRVREGKIDTGVAMFKEEKSRISVELLMGELQRAGFSLLDAHYFPQSRPGKVLKYIVVLSFGIGMPAQMSRNTIHGIEALASTTWENLHGWDNSATEGVNTLNLVGRLPDQKPSKRVALIEGELEVINIAP